MFNNEGTYFMKIKLFALLMAISMFLSGSCAQDEDTLEQTLHFTTTLLKKSLHMTQSIALAHAL